MIMQDLFNTAAQYGQEGLDIVKGIPLGGALKSVLNFVTGEGVKFAFGAALGYGLHELKTRHQAKKNFSKASTGASLTPEVKITLLHWSEETTEQGVTHYDLDSTTKVVDLKKILPDEIKDELPKYIVAAAKKCTPEKPFIFQHLDEATEEYAGLFKTPEARLEYAETVQRMWEDEMKYMVPRQWCGDNVLQQSYEAGAAGHEGFYCFLTHESADRLQEIRLLMIPERYLHEPLPDPDFARVRGVNSATTNHFPDTSGTHRHIERLKTMHKAMEHVRCSAELAHKLRVRIPVRHGLHVAPYAIGHQAPEAPAPSAS